MPRKHVFPAPRAAEERPIMGADESDIESMAEEPDNAHHDHIAGENTPLPEDTFGMALCALSRDAHFLGEGLSSARCCRLMTTLLIVCATITLQVSLLAATKKYVTAKQVHDIRIAYDAFEDAIYQCTLRNGDLDETACFLTKGEQRRGKPEALPDLETQMKRLSTLSADDRGNACRIPLSEPKFFFLILLVWTLTCFNDFRATFRLLSNIVSLKRVYYMKDGLDYDAPTDEEGDQITGDVVISGLTCTIKFFLCMILAIRFAMTCYLLWLGCRWLIATYRFADLILNAIALEFILGLKDLVHNTLVPSRNAKELSMTTIYNAKKKMRPACCEFVGTASIGVLAIVWVLYYMYEFQAVLPEYGWDVHEVCKEYIEERFNVTD